MALSGTLSTKYNGWTYKIDWSATQDIAGNKSTITCKHSLVCASSYDLYIASRSGNTCTVDGVKKEYTSPKISTGGGATIALGTTTHTVNHNADGSKSCTISGVFNIKATLQGTYKASLSVSGTISLNTIARASQPSCITFPHHTQNVGYFGDEIGIHMNRASSEFKHRVYYQFGDFTEEIAANVDNGVTWEIPLGLMSKIPNATSGSGTIYVETYKGSTWIGTKSCGFTAHVPASVKPSCKTQVLDDTKYKDTYGNLVKGLSKLKVNVTGTMAYNSPIVSSKTRVHYTPSSGAGVQMQYSGLSFTTGTLETDGTVTLRTTVTDSRGRTSDEFVVSFPIIDYKKPQVKSLTVHRSDESGTEDENGEWCFFELSASASPLNNRNSASFEVRYKKTTDTAYTTVWEMDFSDDYTYTGGMVVAADSGSAYTVEVVAKDDINEVVLSTTVSTAFTLYNCHRSGTGWSFGKVSEKENTLENALSLQQIGNSYAYQAEAFGGGKGYTLLATIALTELNVNAPIVFEIIKRGALCPMSVYVRFKSSSDTLDPELDTITYEGDNLGAFLVKSATSTWDLYVDNTTGWSNPCLQKWYTSENQNKRVSVTFPSAQISTLPTPYYRATPAKMQSVFDYIYPVGSIYLSYSHVNPSELFGGTWVRLQNAFLWAVDASGTIGQTGGEKEHTLTADEMPKHTHGISVAQIAAGNAAASNLIRYNNDNSSYVGSVVTNSSGGGAAHNNMPPYIQVSAWRRTA